MNGCGFPFLTLFRSTQRCSYVWGCLGIFASHSEIFVYSDFFLSRDIKPNNLYLLCIYLFKCNLYSFIFFFLFPLYLFTSVKPNCKLLRSFFVCPVHIFVFIYNVSNQSFSTELKKPTFKFLKNEIIISLFRFERNMISSAFCITCLRKYKIQWNHLLRT